MKQIVIILTVILLAGCSTSRPIPTQIYQEAYNEPSNSWSTVKVQLSHANTLLDRQQNEEALTIYQQILHDYHSKSGKVELGILTNMSIASLRLGDRDSFLYYSKQVENLSDKFYQLPKNTQLVLVLRDKFTANSNRRGRKISRQMVDAVAMAFTINSTH